MSTYTLKGSPELDARIDADLARITARASAHAGGGVLIGGYGRGEGTPFIQDDGTQAPFNDYDLVVVVERVDSKARQFFRRLGSELSDEIGLPVDLCPYQRSHLRRCEFSLLNYEMKHGHRVLWGTEDLLAPLPDFSHSAIPLSEGLRLLLNRGKLLLDMRRRLIAPSPLNAEERIRFIKFLHKVLLAFGDCALLMAGEYDVSYAAKKVRYPSIGFCPDRDFVVDGYLRAIELKEWGDFRPLDTMDIEEEFDAVKEVFLRFLPWYRANVPGHEGSVVKNLALNLAWNRSISVRHPREQLYDALPDLLRRRPSLSLDRFYRLQRRFS